MSKPIRGWADIVQPYRPAVLKARKRAVGRPKVWVCIVAHQSAAHLQTTINAVLAQHFDDPDIVIVGNEISYGAADFGASSKDRVRVIRNETTVPLAAGFKVLEDNRSVALGAARTDHIDHTGKVAGRVRANRGCPVGQRDSECKSSILEES
jgi:hypothetical protein